LGIFARVLQEVLIAHQGEDYSHLGGQAPRNDPIWHPLRRLAIAPEVISRLKEAATSESRRATLNPDDLEYVADQLRFIPDERRRLRAALLAQGVEIFLRDRMLDDEQPIVSQITQLIYSQLLERFQSPFDRVRGDDAGSPLDVALDIVDRAHAMAQASSVAERQGNHQLAQFWQRMAAAAYEEAIVFIRPLEPELADEVSVALERLKAKHISPARRDDS
jgi:hypothetical protein